MRTGTRTVLRAVVDDVGAGNDLRQMLANRLAHFLIVAEPVACAAREQLIPLRQRREECYRRVRPLPLRLVTSLAYSCASSVVT